MDKGVQPRVAYPYPSQTKISHPSQKKRVKLQPLPEFQCQTRIKTHPLPDCCAWKQPPSQTETVKTYPCQTVGLKTAPFPDRNCEKHTLEGGTSPVHKNSQSPPPPSRGRGKHDRFRCTLNPYGLKHWLWFLNDWQETGSLSSLQFSK